MKRALPILGIAGLALLSVSAPAIADSDGHGNLGKVLVCHATGSETNPYVATPVNLNSLSEHRLESADIVPPNSVLAYGYNWDTAGMANYAKYCTAVPNEEEPPVYEEPTEEEPPVYEEPAEEEPPVYDEPTEEEPAAEEEPTVVVKTPVTPTPVVKTPAVQVAAPQGAAVNAPAAAVSRGTNQGFNAQTAVGATGDSTTWLAGLGVLLGAGAVVAVRRKSRTDSPTAG